VQAAFLRHEVSAYTREMLDLSDPEAVHRALAFVRPDLVLNAAAYTDVDGAESYREAAYAGNALGPWNLASATADRRIPLLHLSSDYVFDGSSRRPYHELDTPSPLSVYGRSKLLGEEAVRACNPRHYIVRTAWLYGPMGRNFALTMRRLAERGDARVVCDQIGSPTYAPHLAAAMELLVATDAYGTYHLAGSGVASWYDLAGAIYRAMGADGRVHPIGSDAYPQQARRPRFSALTTVREPRLVLPPWQQGVEEFAAVAPSRRRGNAERGRGTPAHPASSAA
jgi:dTDP-4-dehydrorhamnose reductase